MTAVLLPDTLEEVTTTSRHLSSTQIAMFQRCSLQYYYRYVLNWSERPSLAMANGKAGHTAVEYALNTKRETQRLPPLDNVLDAYRDAFDAELTKFSPPDFEPDDDPNETSAGTRATLTTYIKGEANLVTPVLIEQAFSLTLPPAEEDGFETPPIVGRIDLIANRLPTMDDTVEVTALTDNKFVRRAKREADANLSDQLTIYDMVMAEAGLPPDRLGFDMFIPPTKTLPPRVTTIYRADNMMTPEVRAARHARLTYKIRTIERQIQRAEFIPTDNPITCAYCGYNTVCQDSKADRWTALRMRQKGLD